MIRLFNKIREKVRKKQDTTPLPEPQPEVQEETVIKKPESFPSDSYTFNEELFDEAILYNENRGAIESGANVYKVVGETGDLGKYQASPETLRLFSNKWLGRVYTPEEFLNDPEAQELFYSKFKERIAVRLQLSEIEAGVAWHNGFGAVGDQYQTDKDGNILKDEDGVEIETTLDYDREKLLESIGIAKVEKDNVKQYLVKFYELFGN